MKRGRALVIAGIAVVAGAVPAAAAAEGATTGTGDAAPPADQHNSASDSVSQSTTETVTQAPETGPAQDVGRSQSAVADAPSPAPQENSADGGSATQRNANDNDAGAKDALRVDQDAAGGGTSQGVGASQSATADAGGADQSNSGGTSARQANTDGADAGAKDVVKVDQDASGAGSAQGVGASQSTTADAGGADQSNSGGTSARQANTDATDAGAKDVVKVDQDASGPGSSQGVGASQTATADAGGATQSNSAADSSRQANTDRAEAGAKDEVRVDQDAGSGSSQGAGINQIASAGADGATQSNTGGTGTTQRNTDRTAAGARDTVVVDQSATGPGTSQGLGVNEVAGATAGGAGQTNDGGASARQTNTDRTVAGAQDVVRVDQSAGGAGSSQGVGVNQVTSATADAAGQANTGGTGATQTNTDRTGASATSVVTVEQGATGPGTAQGVGATQITTATAGGLEESNAGTGPGGSIRQTNAGTTTATATSSTGVVQASITVPATGGSAAQGAGITQVTTAIAGGSSLGNDVSLGEARTSTGAGPQAGGTVTQTNNVHITATAINTVDVVKIYVGDETPTTLGESPQGVGITQVTVADAGGNTLQNSVTGTVTGHVDQTDQLHAAALAVNGAKVAQTAVVGPSPSSTTPVVAATAPAEAEVPAQTVSAVTGGNTVRNDFSGSAAKVVQVNNVKLDAVAVNSVRTVEIHVGATTVPAVAAWTPLGAQDVAVVQSAITAGGSNVLANTVSGSARKVVQRNRLTVSVHADLRNETVQVIMPANSSTTGPVTRAVSAGASQASILDRASSAAARAGAQRVVQDTKVIVRAVAYVVDGKVQVRVQVTVLRGKVDRAAVARQAASMLQSAVSGLAANQLTNSVTGSSRHRSQRNVLTVRLTATLSNRVVQVVAPAGLGVQAV